MARISGFGEVKLAKYAKQFLAEVRAWCDAKGLHSKMYQKKAKRPPSQSGEKRDSTKRKSYDLYKRGVLIAEIAEQRNLSTSTIEGHLAYYVALGEVNVTELVTPEKMKHIEQAIQQHGDHKAGLLKEALGNEYSYGEIHAVIAHRSWRKSMMG